MSKHQPSKAPVPPSHTRTLNACIAAGFIKRIGDSYEITPAGHAYVVGLSASLPTTSTFEGNDHEDVSV
jgi:hypothetical protein